MTSIKRSYKHARARLDELREWATSAEAFLLSFFLTEKIIRRTLVQLVIWKGKTPDDAFKTVGDLSIGAVKDAWKKYNPNKHSLDAVIGTTNWDVIKDAAKLRNELVHGSGHQAQKVYNRQLKKLIPALDEIKNIFAAEYGYSGWRGMKDSGGNKILPPTHRPPR